jgi:hypothetical protein
MAYLDLNADGMNLVIGRSLPPIAVAPSLSRVEREAVMLAKFDGASTLYSAGRMQKQVNRLFGFPTPNGLADNRLEALRRFAVAVAHDSAAVVARERDQLLSLGYGDDQILRAEAVALRYRPAPKPSTGFKRALLFAAGLAIGTWLMNGYFDDLIVSTLASMMFGLPIWAIVARR